MLRVVAARGIAIAGLLFVLLHAAGPVMAAESSDPLLAVLREAGVPTETIGFRPEGTWLRYPDPREIRFKNRLFDDLLADPGRIYPTISLLARAGDRFLAPAYSDTSADALFRLAFFTGWDLHISGFRDYNAALSARPSKDEPLVGAIATLWEDSDRTFDYFSNEQPSDWPRLRDMIRASVAPLDPALQTILAQAVIDLTDARSWHRRAFRNVDMHAVVDVWNVRDWAATQTDGSEFFAPIETISNDLDEASLISSSRKAVYAAGRLATSLRAWKAAGGKMPRFAPSKLAGEAKAVPGEPRRLGSSETRLYTEKNATRSAADAENTLDLWTPAGRIVVSGDGNDAHDERDVFLLVDLGGDDHYTESVGGSSSLSLPISVAVDLDGDDRYESPDEMTLTQGSGFFGTGVLVDLAGRDTYAAGRCAQGFGFFGTGLLADFGGNDMYRLGTGGQGAGLWGVGLLFDRGGDDRYVMDGDGQGYGGIGGIGTLMDYAGKDSYYAEPDARVVPRPDYHSEELINSSNGQGSGMGRRGDMTDGHAWGGGMGTLLDLAGDDDYHSGNWSAGCGYWYGMGFLYDRSGNDRYRASTFSLATGAHFCVGAIMDDGGDDSYEGIADSHTGLGFGHDFTVALLFDRAGDDRYIYGADGFGEAINMSQAFFIDGAGGDTYVLGTGKNGFGSTNFAPESWPPTLEANYQGHATQIGLFLDLGGEDRYLERDAASRAETPSATFRDGVQLQRPSDPETGDRRHFGIFRDMASPGDPGALGWFRVGVR